MAFLSFGLPALFWLSKHMSCCFSALGCGHLDVCDGRIMCKSTLKFNISICFIDQASVPLMSMYFLTTKIQKCFLCTFKGTAEENEGRCTWVVLLQFRQKVRKKTVAWYSQCHKTFLSVVRRNRHSSK